MARRHRDEEAGAVVHVFARGNNRQRIFSGEDDLQLYLGLLGQVVARQGWICLAYCLMYNHVHLLVETPVPNLGNGMQRLHGLYAQTFNRRYRRCGHLFQGRYGGTRVRTDAQLLMTVRYIALNPVTAGLCDTALDWPWSSHALTLGGTPPAWLAAQRLLTYFGVWGSDPVASYQALVR